MKKNILLFALFAIVAAPIICFGEKKVSEEVIGSGVKVSYAPAVGKTFFYRSDADVTTEFSEKGFHQSSLSKSTSYESFTVDSVKNDTTSVTYKFLSSESSTTQDGQMKMNEEEDEMIGQSLTIIVGSDGKLAGWAGLTELEPDESGVDRAEMTASNYASIFFDHFPPEAIAKGSTWNKENTMAVSTKDGDMNQKTTKTYTVDDFVVKDGFDCVKCKIKIVIENTGGGTTEQDGKKVEYTNEGRGEGNGTIYFAFKEGHPVYTTFNWIVDFTIIATDQTTKEENEFKYYQEQKVSYNLAKESDVPKKEEEK